MRLILTLLIILFSVNAFSDMTEAAIPSKMQKHSEVESQPIQEQSSLHIESIPKLNVHVISDVNPFLLLLPFVTIAIVIGSTVITLYSIKTNAAVAKQNFIETIKAQRQISEREIKTKVLADNRQKWINELRTDLSEFCAALHHLTSHVSIVADQPVQTDMAVFTSKVQQKIAKIQLMINPNEPDHSELIELLKKAMSASVGEEKDYRAKMKEILDDLVVKSQKVLKREWERVKELE